MCGERPPHARHVAARLSRFSGPMQAEYRIQSRQRGHGSRDVQRQLGFVGLMTLHFQECYFEWGCSAHPIVSDTCVVTSELDELFEVCTSCVAHGSCSGAGERESRGGAAWRRPEQTRFHRWAGLRGRPQRKTLMRRTGTVDRDSTYMYRELRPLPVEYRGFDE